jgi:8-oxo-dGTP pyrophosphatase MutT (NUDIX family)
MNFKDFLQHIPKIKSEILLGELAHQKMSPPERLEKMKNLDLKSKNPKVAAVMMLLYPKNNKTHLVLIIRNSYPGVHSSQIAFPGGKVETTDDSLSHTALRETHEEIGISPNQIQLIRAFTQVYIPPSNFIVHPFLGFSADELVFNPDSNEVAGIIELELTDFLDEKNVVLREMNTSYSTEIQVPTFKINEHYVWGATAMMLSELKETLKRVL